MFEVLIPLAALSMAGIVSTVRVTGRDGYRRQPRRH
jgi:hypothetical protein